MQNQQSETRKLNLVDTFQSKFRNEPQGLGKFAVSNIFFQKTTKIDERFQLDIDTHNTLLRAFFITKECIKDNTDNTVAITACFNLFLSALCCCEEMLKSGSIFQFDENGECSILGKKSHAVYRMLLSRLETSYYQAMLGQALKLKDQNTLFKDGLGYLYRYYLAAFQMVTTQSKEEEGCLSIFCKELSLEHGNSGLVLPLFILSEYCLLAFIGGALSVGIPPSAIFFILALVIVAAAGVYHEWKDTINQASLLGNSITEKVNKESSDVKLKNIPAGDESDNENAEGRSISCSV